MRCPENVQIQANEMPEGVQKQVYTNAALLVLLEYVRALGGDYDIGGDPGNRWVRVVYPAASKLIRGFLYHPPLTSGQSAFIVIEVDGVNKLDELRLIQEMDAAQVQHLQDFSALGASSVAWWSLVSDTKTDLLVYQNGELQSVRGGAHLLDRYRPIVKKSWRNPVIVPAEELSDGEIAELLARHLMPYDPSRSWVRGYLEVRLKKRRIDHDRRAAREQPLTVPPGDDEDADEVLVPDLRSAAEWKEGNSEQHEVLTQRAEKASLARVQGAIRSLPEREASMVLMRLDGMNDSEIAELVGMRRETVNRKISAAIGKIRESVQPPES